MSTGVESRPVRGGLVRAVLRTPRGAVAVVFLAVLTAACVCAPLLTRFGPLDQHIDAVRGLPSGTYWLGTDVLGRDLLSRILFGGRSSLLGVVEAVVAHLLVAVPAGLVAGYFGGLVDRALMRLAELLMSIPAIMILLAVLAIFGNSLPVAMIALGVLSSGGLMRLVRGAALVAREELYVTAAELMGLSRVQVMLRHVLGRCRGVIIVQTSLFAAIALGVQTGLTFLGLGPQPPEPTWGGMVAEAASVFSQAPWMLVPPGTVIALTVLAFGVLGDVVRDATSERQSAAGAGRATRRAGRTGNAAAPSDALLSVQGLSVAVGGDTPLRLLDDVTFEIAAGEVVGLVGESGSGKSMTARALIGLLPTNCLVESGHVVFDGTDLAELDEAAYRAVRGRQIAMISQEPMGALDPSFRIGSLVGEVVRTVEGRRGRAVRDRVVELLTMVEIPDAADVARRYPHQISGGMAQRVAIAMALAGGPRLLIADEPTTALDVTVQAEILDLLRRLQQENGMAVLLVSHNLGVIADMCSKVLVLYAGQVVEQAAVDALFAAPAHPYAAALLASSPEKAGIGQPIRAIPGTVPAPEDWPTGCRFANRCELVEPACRAEAIPLVDVGADHHSRCIRIPVLLEQEATR
ncbi:dipeptide/oligopeptide/nickel ABC transporter permease/ATP-binding protein [Cryptosporangium arvum]|uniref:Oligopeptide/dipeptide ABC transporter, ATP-binding protein n=1 Tax=Cryptosporangium arvum DSM 44712 TaxID=927661 RepID=A0A010Z5U0_9ACTN|nr:dipeptide/oligopeptide/nickel ABC transporter permease/ATP-binding protein [Cryptosporangium arvum]EXG82698.1 oligopeptide/dipeptide ABC transporter, ATP-binding protein [Cryptosporangium arvum DSM 44712]